MEANAITDREDRVDPFGPAEEPETRQESLIPEGAMPVNLAELTQQYIDTDRRKKDLETELKEVKAQLARMEPVLVDRFAANNIQNQKLKSGETVFIRRDTYVSLATDDDGSHAEAHEALQRNGLEFLVKPNVNSQQLSGWYRERLNQEEEIPQDLLPYLNVSEVFRVRVRK